MPKVLFFVFLVASTPFLGETDDLHQQVSMKMLDYIVLHEQCEQQALARELPGQDMLTALSGIDEEDLFRFLFSVSIQARNQCERPALTELAYIILLSEHEQLSPATVELIESVRELAFPNHLMRARKVYAELPAEITSLMEKYSYFHHPFDERKLMELIRKTDSLAY